MTMIAITTINGRLHVFADVPIPNAPAGQWDAMRIKALARDIEAHIDGNELADLSAKHDAPPTHQRQLPGRPWPPRKESVKSGLVVVPEDEINA